jgi:hypothetical protein
MVFVPLAPLMPVEIKFFGRYKGGFIRDGVVAAAGEHCPLLFPQQGRRETLLNSPAAQMRGECSLGLTGPVPWIALLRRLGFVNSQRQPLSLIR